MACSAIVHGVEPKEENLLRYVEQEQSGKTLLCIESENTKPEKTKLGWQINGILFEDGSELHDWKKIEGSPWNWQYDDHELTFDIYEVNGGYWKLYRARHVPEGAKNYEHHYGGQACKVAKVGYKTIVRSPHSGTLKYEEDTEWVRVEEVDKEIHDVIAV